eukprot:992105_1
MVYPFPLDACTSVPASSSQSRRLLRTDANRKALKKMEKRKRTRDVKEQWLADHSGEPRFKSPKFTEIPRTKLRGAVNKILYEEFSKHEKDKTEEYSMCIQRARQFNEDV